MAEASASWPGRRFFDKMLDKGGEESIELLHFDFRIQLPETLSYITIG